jgi:hypothetical protein
MGLLSSDGCSGFPVETDTTADADADAALFLEAPPLGIIELKSTDCSRDVARDGLPLLMPLFVGIRLAFTAVQVSVNSSNRKSERRLRNPTVGISMFTQRTSLVRKKSLNYWG